MFGIFIMVGLISPPLEAALNITPTYQLFSLKKGKRAKGEFKLTNTGTKEMKITPSYKDWFTHPANKEIQTSDWFEIESEPFVLAPTESRIVHFKVTAPKKAKGELVAMSSFLIEIEEEQFLNKRLSVAIYVGIEGTEKLKGKLAGVSVTPKNKTVQAGIMLENQGNVHIRPEGLIQLRNESNRPVANVLIKKARPTFPGGRQVYSNVVRDLELKPGLYTAHVTMRDKDRGEVIIDDTQKFTINKDGEVKAKQMDEK
jgi:hypothetical protein